VTRQARTLQSYLESLSDKNTGRGRVLLADLSKLLDAPKRPANVNALIRECELAGQLFNVQYSEDGMLSYRVMVD